MKIEILVATMHQKDFSKYSEMNLQTDAVIANQSDFCETQETEIKGKKVKLVTTNTRGASTNRNIAISNSTADIIVFSDDDQEFVKDYENKILSAFEHQPDVDAIKFYCESTNPERKKRSIMSAGVHCLAIKRKFLEKNQIGFDETIGPGKKIYCGEDSVFLNDLLKRNCNIYLSPELIGYVHQEESSWFQGINEQFCISTGFVYYKIYGFLAPLFILRRTINTKKRKNCNFPFLKMLFLMLKGLCYGIAKNSNYID